jgi:hypothetical protein
MECASGVKAPANRLAAAAEWAAEADDGREDASQLDGRSVRAHEGAAIVGMCLQKVQAKV